MMIPVTIEADSADEAVKIARALAAVSKPRPADALGVKRGQESREPVRAGEASAEAPAGTATRDTAPGTSTLIASGVAQGKHAPAACPAGMAVNGISGQAGECRGVTSGPGISREVVARPDATDASGEAGLASSPRRTIDEIAAGYKPTPVIRLPDEEPDIPTFLDRRNLPEVSP